MQRPSMSLANATLRGGSRVRDRSAAWHPSQRHGTDRAVVRPIGMTSPRTRLLAVGAVSAAFAASCIASLSTEPDSGGPLLPTPAAAAGALTPFVGCADVRDWYVEQAMSRVTAWGLDEPIYSDVVRLSVRDALRTSKTEAVGSSAPAYSPTAGLIVMSCGGCSPHNS